MIKYDFEQAFEETKLVVHGKENMSCEAWAIVINIENVILALCYCLLEKLLKVV